MTIIFYIGPQLSLEQKKRAGKTGPNLFLELTNYQANLTSSANNKR